MSEQPHTLLIVPYGIETMAFLCEQKEADGLLIVPYGIETIIEHLHYFIRNPFNRTLWN